MRKLRLLFIALFVTFISITNVSASTVTKERTKENNYGVKKNWSMNEEKYNYAKKTPYVDASEKIYDFSDILTDEEEKALYDRIIPMIEEYKMEIIILTYDYPYSQDMDNSYFVSDFYDFNDFGLDFTGYSGVVLFRNTYSADPYFDMLSFGEAQLKYYDTRMSTILDSIYFNIKNHHYLNGFNQWLDLVKTYHTYDELTNYHLDATGHLKKDFNPLILPNIIISAVITLIFILVNVRKNKMVRTATQASSYLNKETFILLEQSDKLISSHTTSYTESSSSSGGGGGGHSSFSGHSGGGFSSGGGRHG